MKVLKFGGSSLSTPATIREVGRLLLDARRREPVIGVVSAFQGVTNQLLECARLAERADASLDDAFDQIARRHRSAVTHLIGSARPGRLRHDIGSHRPYKATAAGVRAHVDALLAELRSTLQGIQLLRHCPPRALDMTASFGERLSALSSPLIWAAATNQPSSMRASCSSRTISSPTRTCTSRRRTGARAHISRESSVDRHASCRS